MGKTRDLFNKMSDTKGTIHANMGTIKDRNGMDLTEAEDIKKRWLEYVEELYKKDLHDPDNHNAVITETEPDILECKVKWILGSITMNKASGSHPCISRNQVAVPKLYILLAQSLTPAPFLKACPHYCLEMIMINFHLTI